MERSNTAGAGSADLFAGDLNGLDLDAFVAICADPTGGVITDHAAEVIDGIPIYDGDRLRQAAASPDTARLLQHELAQVFGAGSGVLAIRNAWSDRSTLDAMTDVLWAIIAREKADGDGFDHFASAGANSRAWDVLGKSAKLDPATYVSYYSNTSLDMVGQAWLGPWYQLTAQVNVVHPTGAAQSPHRDYHLGFLSDADAARFPAHVHQLSQVMTLQGAVAHTAMPLESGPTMLLPGSQRFLAGYLAWRDERFRNHFAEHSVQLELEPGDAVFFNPGLHHAAGENRTTDHDRMGNLLQVSSAFGVPMESIDWTGITLATYPTLLERAAQGTLVDTDIACCATGYSFPSNLDTDISDAGLAPASMQDLLRSALHDRCDLETFTNQVEDKMASRRAY